MSKYRHRLPQLRNALFLTDGGLETTLVFHEHVELPYFAAFDGPSSRQNAASTSVPSPWCARLASR